MPSRVLSTIVVASALLGVLTAAPVVAEQVTSASVVRSDGTFSIDFSVRIDAPVADVSRLIGDIRNLALLSPSTQSSETLQPGEGINTGDRAWVHVVIRPCVLIFCKKLTKVSRVMPVSAGVTRYEAIAAHSNFESATEVLTLKASGSATELTYEARLVPAFFVPPVIGSWLVRRVIIAEISEAARRAEQQIKSRQDDV